MISPTHGASVFLCHKAVDFRFGFDRLAGICKTLGEQNPYDGSYFVFFNRSLTRAKIIYYDGSGCCLFWKRLEKGKFRLNPKNEESLAGLSNSDLLLLLEGVDYSKVVRPPAWNPSSSI